MQPDLPSGLSNQRRRARQWIRVSSSGCLSRLCDLFVCICLFSSYSSFASNVSNLLFHTVPIHGYLLADEQYSDSRLRSSRARALEPDALPNALAGFTSRESSLREELSLLTSHLLIFHLSITLCFSLYCLLLFLSDLILACPNFTQLQSSCQFNSSLAARSWMLWGYFARCALALLHPVHVSL